MVILIYQEIMRSGVESSAYSRGEISDFPPSDQELVHFIP